MKDKLLILALHYLMIIALVTLLAPVSVSQMVDAGEIDLEEYYEEMKALEPDLSDFFTTRTGLEPAKIHVLDTLTIPLNTGNIASTGAISHSDNDFSVRNPCSNIVSLGTGGSGNPRTFSNSGTGTWVSNACGYICNGKEQVYSFTAPYTGKYSIKVTSTNSTWVDYFYKTGTCGSSDWNCISDIYTPGTYGNINMNAGTTYYILLDAESTAFSTHTFFIYSNPCSNIVSLGAGGAANTKTYFRSGYGEWTSNACGYNCLGQEQIYSFVAPYTGKYSIQVTSTNNTWVDYFWKTGTCDSNDWNCISFVKYPGVYGNMSLTAGTTYYILVDAESADLATQSFFIFFTPCLNITPIAGTGPPNAQTYSGGGNGAWFTTTVSPCGYTCPGIENIYSFTPSGTGTYHLEVTAASGFVDYMWKSGTCNSGNWECISDISAPGVYGSMSMTAGITYYILLDDENTTPGTHQFFIQDPIPPGTWIGIANSSWHNPANWSNGVVPATSTNVTIPAGTPYSPVVSSPATCNVITVKSGANLTVAGNGLTVAGSFNVEGTLTMNNSASVLTVGQTYSHILDFKTGSVALLTAGTINCYGWLFPREGSTFNPSNNVTIYFKGVTGGGPSNYNPTATYGNIVIEKNAGQIAFFALNATQPLVVTGNFTVSANNTFEIHNHTMVVNGIFTDHSTSQVFLSGTIKNREGMSSEVDYKMSDTPVLRGGMLEIDTDFTLNGLLNVADGDVLLHGEFESTSTSSVIINGGSFINDRPFSNNWTFINGQINMTAGLFELTNNHPYFTATAFADISGGILRTGGSFFAVSGVFQPSGGVVEITENAPGNSIFCHEGSYFHDLRIDRGALSETFLSINTLIKNGLFVDEGKLIANNRTITVEGNVEINSGGNFKITDTGKLLMGASGTLTVNNGGTLEFFGHHPSFPTTMSRISTGYYALNIESGGTLAAQNATFEYMNTNGVYVKPGGVIDAAKAFTNCTFRNGQSGGRLLMIQNNQTFEVLNPYFPANTWGGSYNVYKNVNQGNVTFTEDTGPFSGSAFEFDPNNRIHWSSDIPPTGFSLELQVILEGAYTSGGPNLMHTILRDNTLVPLAHPYNPSLPYFGNSSPLWYYTGSESTASVPAGVVDWVLVELRDAPTPGQALPATVLARKAAFLHNDGFIRDITGGMLSFDLTVQHNLYVVVYHRNHLAVMSSGALPLDGDVYSWNFTQSLSKAFTSTMDRSGYLQGHKNLGSGVFGMYGGDGDGNGQIQTQDKNDVWNAESGLSGYRAGDFDMNSQVQSQDKNNIWNANSGVATQVP